MTPFCLFENCLNLNVHVHCRELGCNVTFSDVKAEKKHWNRFHSGTNWKTWFRNPDSVPTLPEPTKSRFEDEFRLLSGQLVIGPGIEDAANAIFSWCFTEGQLTMESVCFLNSDFIRTATVNFNFQPFLF